jgi:hypothetical protein
MLTYRALEAKHGGVAVLPFTRMHVEYELAHKAPCIAFPRRQPGGSIPGKLQPQVQDVRFGARRNPTSHEGSLPKSIVLDERRTKTEFWTETVKTGFDAAKPK